MEGEITLIESFISRNYGLQYLRSEEVEEILKLYENIGVKYFGLKEGFIRAPRSIVESSYISFFFFKACRKLKGMNNSRIAEHVGKNPATIRHSLLSKPVLGCPRFREVERIINEHGLNF